LALHPDERAARFADPTSMDLFVGVHLPQSVVEARWNLKIKPAEAETSPAVNRACEGRPFGARRRITTRVGASEIFAQAGVAFCTLCYEGAQELV